MNLTIQTLLSSTLGTLTLIPFLAIVCIVNQIARLIVQALLNRQYGGQIELNTTGYDSMYMFKGYEFSRRTVLYIAVLTSHGKYDIRKHRRNYSNQILQRKEYSKLKKIWVQKWGYTCLKNADNFDIKDHVKLYKSSGGNEPVTESVLMNTILPELCKDIEGESKPQWEDLIIENFTLQSDPAMPKTLRIMRVHHGYFDGISNLLMLADTQSGQPLSKFPWVIDPLSTQTVPLSSPFYKALAYLNIAAACIKNIVQSQKFLPTRQSLRPETFTGTTTHGWTQPLDIKLLQEIKKQTGCSMPSILTTIVVTSMKKYLEEFGSKEQQDMEELTVGLVAALLPYQSLSLQNNHCILPFKLDSRPDLPRRLRLWSIHQELGKYSNSPDPYLNHLLPHLYGQLPLPISNFCTSLITGDGIISNFPVSREHISLNNHNLLALGGYVPLLTPTGFACVTMRYGNELRFCLNSDSSFISPEGMTFLTQTITAELHFLHKEITCGRRTPSKGSFLVGRFQVVELDEENNNYSQNHNHSEGEEALKRGLSRNLSGSPKKVSFAEDPQPSYVDASQDETLSTLRRRQRLSEAYSRVLDAFQKFKRG